ncbi:hypothetical protein [Saccharicrinis sp. GN24d3]|uniref:hypothetical protein n=1 Tax=Saccharicrinis sp. GN24d3 TaxID=3458416 RepID=UPI004036C98F
MQQKDKEVLNNYMNDLDGAIEQIRAEKWLSSNKTIGIKESMNNDCDNIVNLIGGNTKVLNFILNKVRHNVHLWPKDNKTNLAYSIYKCFYAASAITIVALIVTGVFSLIKLKETNKMFSKSASVVFIEAPNRGGLFVF